jgi:hypothetical protein
MSEPRKYGDVFQLALRSNTRFRLRPTAAAMRVPSPIRTRSPTAISVSATAMPASCGCGSANIRSSAPPGVPLANPCSWVPM